MTMRWIGWAFLLVVSTSAQAGDISKCLGAGGHWSCVTGDAGASTSRISTDDEVYRKQIYQAQPDALVVLDGGLGTDQFFQAAAFAQELMKARFTEPKEAALAILEIAQER